MAKINFQKCTNFPKSECLSLYLQPPSKLLFPNLPCTHFKGDNINGVSEGGQAPGLGENLL